MMQDQLKNILEYVTSLPCEIEWVEFKVGNSYQEQIGEYISAISNAATLHGKRSGYLVYGVEDVTHSIVGTDFRPTEEKIGNQELENWLSTQLTASSDFTINEGVVDGKYIVIFQIPAAVQYPTKFRGKAHIRVGSYKKMLDDHPAKEAELWRKLNTTSFEMGWAAEALNINDVLQRIDYEEMFKKLTFPAPTNKEAIAEKLIEEKVLEEVEGLYSITNYGAILFARDLSLFPHLERKAPRVVVYDGEDRLNTRRTQVGLKGYALGFEGLNSYLLSQLPSREEVIGATRKTTYSYSPLALRELVANMLIHQDFTTRGNSPMIEIFSNRIEFMNPGEPLIDAMRFVDASPQSRNERIADRMRRMGYCEEQGSGIDKVVFECEKLIAPAPHIEDGEGYTRVTLFAPRVMKGMDINERNRAAYLHSCLKYVSSESMTNESLRERFGISKDNYPQASKIIRNAVDAGLIKAYDPTNSSRKLSKYVPFWAQAQLLYVYSM